MKIVLIILSILASNSHSNGQHKIFGEVKDNQDNPILGANVYIEGAYDGASTDENGAFSFSSFEAGRQTIIASCIGFRPQKKVIELSRGSSKVEFFLEEEINKIDGVTISAGAFEASDKKKSVILKTFDIVTTAGATADITGVMNTLPGTQAVGEEGKLFVRGGAGHEAKTFINGLLVAEAYSQTPLNIPSRFRFSPFLFKGAFFSTGGYSSEYGQALSSILQLNTHDLPLKSQTDISVMSVGGDVSQTIRKNNISVYGQLQYTDLAAYFALVPQQYAWDKAPSSLNSTLHFKQRFENGGNIQAYTNFDRSRMKIDQPLSGNFYKNGTYDISNHNFYTNLSLNLSVSDKASLRGGGSFTSNKNRIILDHGLVIENHLKSFHIKTVFDHDISQNVMLKYGYEWIFNNFSEEVIDADNSIHHTLSYENHLVSPFAEADVYLSNKFVTRFGARFEYNSLLNEKHLSPRASIAYKTSKSSQISLAWGKFAQSPISEYLKFGQPLQSEKASHYIMNYQYSNGDRIFRSEVYYKKYDQLTTKERTEDVLLSNSGYGDAKGFELFWRDSQSFNSIDYWISYSYLDTKRKYDIFPRPVMPYYASNHNLSIVYKQFISKIKSQIGWTYSFASGRPYTDPNTMHYNSKRTKSYSDISMNYSFLVKPNMIIHASVSNVFGFVQIFGYTFNREPNEMGAYEAMPVKPQAKRFLFLGFFLTISKDKNANQLNNL